MLFLKVILLVLSAGGLDGFPCGSCTCKNQLGRISAYCNGKALLAVPKDLPPHIVYLNLSHNFIADLSNGLQRYGSLLKLDVSYNHLKFLNNDDFTELFNLSVLNLSNNRLSLSNVTYPKDIFRHQQKLSKLIVHRNSEVEGSDLAYPDESFRALTSLQYLSIDGLQNRVFGKGFQNLVKLTNLTLKGNCNIRTLRNDTFTFLSAITFLWVNQCQLIHIDPGAFEPMKNIILLDVSVNVNLGIPKFGVGMYGLQNSTIKILRANRLNTHHGAGVRITNEDLKYLSNTQVEELHLDGNRIEVLDSEVILNLPSTIKRISVKNNMFIFGMYILTASIMTGLDWVDGSWQHQLYAHPFTAKDLQLDSIPFKRKVKNVTFKKNQKLSLSKYFHINNETFDSIKDDPWPGNFTIYIPPNVTFANVSYSKLSFTIPKIQFGPNKLKTFDLSHNFFTRWEGPLLGFEQLEYLDISHNYCDYVSDEMTRYFPLLKTLNISSNYLGYSLTVKTFLALKYLEILDLSNNKINHLPHRFLHNVATLKLLNLSSNYLTTWDFNIQHMVNLSDLDLSNNLFDELPENLESQLAKMSTRLKIHFKNNPLMCTCKTLSSLKWIQRNGVGIIKFQSITCTLPDGTKADLQNLHDILLELEKVCTSYVGVMFGVLSLLVNVVAVLILGLVYRYRWKLRYLYYLTLNKHRGYLPVEDEEQNFEFDAFVAYADEDRGFVVREMRKILEESEEQEETFRLCIHHRDFLAGEAIAANILKAINTSRKTVVILTRNFLKSSWCRYEVEMAKVESIYRGRNTLLIVVMEDIPAKDLPADILELMRKESYVEFTNDREGQEVFWLNLKKAIRR